MIIPFKIKIIEKLHTFAPRPWFLSCSKSWTGKNFLDLENRGIENRGICSIGTIEVKIWHAFTC